MELALRILLRLLALGMLIGAVGFMFNPAAMEADFAVRALETHGMGTLRGDLGGTFLMLAIFTFHGSRPGSAAWLAVPLVFMLTVLFGRVVHIVLDGLTDPAIRSTIIELIAVAILEYARRKLATENNN
ncbi:MAG: hypothetical protein P8I40_08200 [Porticoccaceae bacterium]|jgi:hypothetical protein|nr:hypothetical protein [Porticoccaceae bacterium]MDG1200393.1 hypothetical protein [Porticoccaceae bacterium]MDG1706617.1 hypothetical protein [Porticoccaceae bacterium]